MYEKPKILPEGDKAVLVEFGNEISEECNDKVMALYGFLKEKNIKGIISLVPTYRSLLIKYEPLTIPYKEITSKIENMLSSIDKSSYKNAKVIEIPVVYGDEFGPDLEFVASYNKLTPEEVIEIHTKPLYRIYMLGFTMGFAYLGGMSEKIATPRLERPREKIPAGSVGIADKQTGIYPIESPGGWRLIGQTPVKIYDPKNERPILLEAGNYLKFVRIAKEEFYKIREEVNNGKFNVKTYDYAN
ncbi:5-oxoprolinase subunit PxpB [Thermovenabulum gondwanense]|uniref:Kinase A inhibitor n=1 Tax=Thermovenabulum gondwanense TaxID=520767 RepID=A0A161PY81_9FIRM|nr:5-oxoprolinase subunit PxpB [Thermovenabulum gondwanense]KYO66974.1 Kinase A inhibitor [Thermovenabulum gondwanense]